MPKISNQKLEKCRPVVQYLIAVYVYSILEFLYSNIQLTIVDPLSKGMMDFVSSDHGIAKDLRKYVIFKFFPVVCPDGVFLGNSRCTLLGADLNRPVHVLLFRRYPKFIQIKFG